jgi:hypothetical protein
LNTTIPEVRLAADKLILIDTLQAIRVRPRDRSIGQLIENLRIASGVEIVHQVLRGQAVHRLRYLTA